MNFHSVKLENIGLFRGEHQFDFSPRHEYSSNRLNLTTIRGLNGSGKSTIFNALIVGLFGRLALGDRVSKVEYHDYLRSLMHTKQSNGSPKQMAKSSSISVLIEYVRSGIPVQIETARSWHLKKGTVIETISIRENDVTVELDDGQAQEWIIDHIPISFRPLMFFDTERMDEWTANGKASLNIGVSIERLLNLHLVRRLDQDLGVYISNRGAKKEPRSIRKEFLASRERHEELQKHRERQKEILDTLQEELGESLEILRQQEREAASEGAVYAQKRTGLRDRLNEVERKLDEVEDEFRNLSGGLLPFVFANEWLTKLQDRLSEEKEARQAMTVNQALAESYLAIEKSVSEVDLWHGLEISASEKRTIRNRIKRTLKSVAPEIPTASTSFLHNYSDEDQETLKEWIKAIHSRVPQAAAALSQFLKSMRQEKMAIQQELSKAPEDQRILPIFDKISLLEIGIEENKGNIDLAREEIGSLDYQLEENQRIIDRLESDLIEILGEEKDVEYAHKSRLVARTYLDALLHQRIGFIEEKMIEGFNAINRKDDLLSKLSIDASDYSIQFVANNGAISGIESLSLGERQILAMATLWALRKVSGQDLPLFIDAPLARLDGIHRSRLVDHYFHEISEQVILFSTDAEIDDALYNEMKEFISHSYTLVYDPKERETKVEYENPSLVVDTKIQASSL